MEDGWSEVDQLRLHQTATRQDGISIEDAHAFHDVRAGLVERIGGAVTTELLLWFRKGVRLACPRSPSWPGICHRSSG